MTLLNNFKFLFLAFTRIRYIKSFFFIFYIILSVDICAQLTFIEKKQKKYTSIGKYSNNRAEVKINDKYGYIDMYGNEIIPLVFEDAWRFSEGLACIKQNGLYGYIDTMGTNIIIPRYTYAWPFKKGRAKVKIDTKYSISINKDNLSNKLLKI